MNYKKILSLLLAASMTVSMPINVFATQPVTETENQTEVTPYGTPDTKAPVLHSVSVDKDIVQAGESFELSLNITDDISGVYIISTSFINETTGTLISNPFEFVETSEDDTYTFSIQVPENEASGALRLDHVELRDKNNNAIIYRSSKNSEALEYLLPNEIIIQVENQKGEDLEAPKLIDVSVTPETVKSGEYFTLNLDVTDDMSGVDYISAYFVNKQNGRTISLDYFIREPITEGKVQVEWLVDEYEGNGSFYLDHVQLSDVTGHSVIYRSYSSNFPEEPYLPKGVELTVTNDDTEDIIPPKLHSVSIDKNTVEAPGQATLTLDISDDISGVNMVGIYFVNKQNDRTISVDDFLTSHKNGKIQLNIPVSEFEPSGIFDLRSVTLYDTSGNSVQYDSINVGYDPENPLPNEISFFVKNVDDNDQSGDIITSTNNPTLVDDIKSMEEGSTAHIYYGNGASLSKDVFEAIKGQDKTISLESAGIEWIFNGQDIEDENIKDIDLTTDINLSWNSDSEAAQEIPWDQNAIVLSFADNGTLPAPAKIRIKMDYAFKDSVGTDNLYVYYYDNTNKEFVQVAANLVITDDDYLEFTITHNSDFVITDGELKKKEPENPDPTPTPDPTPSNPDKGTSSNSSASSSSAVNYESEKPNPTDKKAVEAYNFWQNAKAKVRTTPDGKTMRLFVPKDITYMPASMMETLYREKITLIITHNGKKIVIPAGKAMPKQKLKVYWTFESLEKLYQA